MPAIPAAIAAGAAIYGAVKDAKAKSTAAQYQMDTANRAGELEAQSARDALNFAKQQELARREEWTKTTALNERMFRDQLASDEGKFYSRRKDLKPFMQFGYGALGQMADPLPQAGSLGTLAGR